jgi:UDP-glucose 4-epimerase
MKLKNVIVTGGAGFIGSNLCKILSQKSYHPITLDNLSTGFKELVKYGDFIECDIGDYKKMMEIFLEYEPLAVFHIAGSKSVEESVKNPYKYYDNNVVKTNSLLKAVIDSNIKHFIFSSTATIFGIQNQKQKHIPENAERKPINPYGTSKLMIEEILENYDQAYGLKHSTLRYFNVSGADPELELGEISEKPANIFPLLIQTIDGKRDEFVIFGDDYNTEDGTCIRDYIHVWDLVNAHVKALEKQIATNESAKINLGNGVGFSVKQVVEVFRKITDKDFKVRIGKRRAGDPDLLMADVKFAKEYLDWHPKYTNLEDHAKHALDWYRHLHKKL